MVRLFGQVDLRRCAQGPSIIGEDVSPGVVGSLVKGVFVAENQTWFECWRNLEAEPIAMLSLEFIWLVGIVEDVE